MKPDMLITVVGSFNLITFVLLVFGVRGWKAGVNILRCLLVLGVFPGLHAGDIGNLERTVFVKSTTDEVGAVRKIRGARTNLDWAASQSSLLPRRLHMIQRIDG
jgi:hypothetical protein